MPAARRCRYAERLVISRSSRRRAAEGADRIASVMMRALRWARRWLRILSIMALMPTLERTQRHFRHRFVGELGHHRIDMSLCKHSAFINQASAIAQKRACPHKVDTPDGYRGRVSAPGQQAASGSARKSPTSARNFEPNSPSMIRWSNETPSVVTCRGFTFPCGPKAAPGSRRRPGWQTHPAAGSAYRYRRRTHPRW